MLWVLKRTVSMRRFFWAPKTHVEIDGLENNHNFALIKFSYLDLWIQRHVPVCAVRICAVWSAPLLFTLESLTTKLATCTVFFSNVGSLCSWADWLVSYLETPKTGFSGEAHINILSVNEKLLVSKFWYFGKYIMQLFDYCYVHVSCHWQADLER